MAMPLNISGGRVHVSPLELLKKQGAAESGIMLSNITSTLSGAIIGRGASGGAVAYWDSVSSITSSQSFRYVEGSGLSVTGTLSSTRYYIGQSSTAPTVGWEVASKQYVDDSISHASGQTWYFDETASDVATYFTLSANPENLTEDIDTVTVNNNTALIEAYASMSGGLGTVFVPDGVWVFSIYGKVDSAVAGNSYIVIDTYKRASGGTETLLFSTTSTVLSTTVDLYEIETVQSAISLLASDRLVVKINGKTTANSNRVVSFYHNGITHYSHIHTPISIGGSGGVGQSGYSGYSGFSGFSGFSGYSGIGQSGFSGYSGAGVTITGTASGVAIFTTATSVSSYPSYTFNVNKQSLNFGSANSATGSYSYAHGSSCSAYGANTTAEGYLSIARGNNSHAEGTQSISLGESSHAEGANSTASGDMSHAQGYQAVAYRRGQQAMANGAFVFDGDAQSCQIVARQETTTNTTTQLTLDGSSNPYTMFLQNSTTYVFQIDVVCRNSSTAVNEYGAWVIYGLARRNGTVGSTFVTGVSKTALYASAGLDCNVVGNNVYGSLDVEVNGTVGNTFKWVATIRWTEVMV